jgi:hypothetical protein
MLASALHCGASDDDAASGAAGVGGALGGAGGGGATPEGGTDAGCVKDAILCEGSVAWRCDATGSLVDPVDCANEDGACVTGLGCAVCVPGSTGCSDGIGTYCLEDGSRVESFECDPLRGLSCQPEGCFGACTPQTLGRTHAGCDFWPTVTANSAWSPWFPFGVLVVNTTDLPATLTVTRGADTVLTRALDPAGVEVIELPWIEELKGPDADPSGKVVPPPASVLSQATEGGGAFRIRSDQPVVVTQFNTLRASNEQGLNQGCPPDTSSGECLSYSNDASLLLPSSSLDTTHELMGWKSWQLDPGANDPRGIGDFVSITAVEDGTTVMVKPSNRVLPFASGEGIDAGATRTFNLVQGDVLQLFADASVQGAQLAGSEVSSTRPIQVLTGVSCVNVPVDVLTCDHVEEMNLPRGMLGRRYLVTALASPSGRTRHLVRIHGIEDETVIAFDPPTAHKSISIHRGETVDLDLPKDGEPAQDFLVSSTKPFGVTQYMIGNRAEPYTPSAPGADLGDPSQTFAVPVSRYLKRYFVAVPPGFTEHRIDLIASTGSDVLLNNEPIASEQFRAIGASGLSVARIVGVEPGKRYELRSDKAFGVQVYGFGKFTGWMVPGGIEMRSSSQ